MGKPNKYNAIKTTIDGITFDSKAESRRYSELKLLERVGDIKDLELQPQFQIAINGVKVCTYKSDFQYFEKLTQTDDETAWVNIVEDVKGMKTPVYRLKKKLMKAVHNIEIRETK